MIPGQIYDFAQENLCLCLEGIMKEDQQIIGACQVCGGNHYHSHYDLLLKCSNCGFVTANMSVSFEEQRKLYDTSYFSGDEYVDYQLDERITRKNFRRKISRFLKKVSVEKVQSVLEIGAAYGYFGDELVQRIPGVRYKGYDVFIEAVNHAREQLKLDVSSHDYLSVEEKTSFTDVFMWDVIEHLPDPDAMLRKLSREMTSGGRLVLSTGDIDRFIPRMRKSKWRLIHPPTHLHYFSKKTIIHFLEKHGFEVISVRYPGILRSIHLMYYSLFLLRKEKPSRFHQWVYKRIPKSWSLKLNTFDVMEVIAVKKGNTVS